VILLFASMLLFFALGIPIAFSVAMSSCIYALTSGMNMIAVAQRMVNGADSFTLMAIPFFILAGEIMNQGGITQRLVELAKAFIGQVRGGMTYVVILTNMIMAGVSGSSIADACAIGSVTIPAMEKEGYKRDFATALNGAAATIGPIIPPSMGFVMYATIVGCSVGDLFLAGILPGVLMGVIFGVLCFWKAKRENFPLSDKSNWSDRFRTSRNAFWAVLMPVVILGGILSGVVTPTEAAVLACVYGLVVSLVIYRSISFADLPYIMLAAVKSSLSIMIIVACASAFGWMLTIEGTPQALVAWFTSVSNEQWVFLILVNLILIVLGCFIDVDTLIIVFVPLLLPLLKTYDVNLVWFGVVFTVNTMIGQLTPPVGELLYAVSSVGKVPVLKTSKALIPFYFALLVALIIVTYVPQISLLLPGLFGYSS
jgi:tripartite ATP-independent transporter DctM subunit